MDTSAFSRRQAMLAAVAAASAHPPTLQAGPSHAVEPHFWTLSQAAGQLRQRRISSEELTKLCLTRIAKQNPELNAFLTVTEEEVLVRARACDRERRPRGLLHGIPIALKDNIDTAGIRTTAASKLFESRVPTMDAEVARRTRQAGAVLLGKLNLDEFAFEGTGTTGAFGPTYNPWNRACITGGSSSGSAAALAAGLCYGSVGSDDGGSVRIPGAHCGIVGFKPSYGRVSTRGIIPSVYSLDCAGPLARSVEDAALLLQVLAGADPDDTITVDQPVPDYIRALGAGVRSLRIGIPRSYFFEQLHPDVAQTVETAIALLRPQFREIRDVVLPRFEFVENGSYDIELYHYHRPLFEQHPEQYHPWSRRQLEAARQVSAERYVETLKRLRECRRDIRRIFEQVDVLLLPTMREPAPVMSEIVNRTHRRLPSNVSAFNRFGLPALTLPCGFSREGLPIGLQVVGPYLGECVVLTTAYAYQQATDWHLRHPVGA